MKCIYNDCDDEARDQLGGFCSGKCRHMHRSGGHDPDTCANCGQGGRRYSGCCSIKCMREMRR